jgi:hypothetical protein
VKDFSLQSSLGNLLLIQIKGEMQFDGVCIKGKEAEAKTFAGMPKLNKQQDLQFAMHRNLLSRVWLKVLTFGSNFYRDV